MENNSHQGITDLVLRTIHRITNPPRCLFLEMLPLELRIMIYQAIFGREKEFKIYDIHRLPMSKAIMGPWTGANKDGVTYDERISLMFTCRQIFMESSPIFYKSTTFTCKPHQFSRIKEITPTIRLSLIRRLQIGPLCQAEPCGPGFDFSPYNIPHWFYDKAIDAMGRMTLLRDLQIVVCWGGHHRYGGVHVRTCFYHIREFASAIRGLDWMDGHLVFPRYMGPVLEGVLGVERDKIFEPEILSAPTPISLQSDEGVDMACMKAEKLLAVRLRDMTGVEGRERGGSVADSEDSARELLEHYGVTPPP